MKEGPDISPGSREEALLHRSMAGEYVRRRASEGSRRFEDYWNSEALRSLSRFPKGAVLDCCCGDGILLGALDSAYDRVTGIDISEEMLSLARKRVGSGDIELVQGNIEDLPFDDSSFDAAVFRGSFHHMSDPWRCLSEVRRVLRPGGGVVLFEPNGDPAVWRLLRKCYYPLSKKISSVHRFYRRRELADLLEGAGFSPGQMRTIFFFSYPFAGLLDHFPLFGWIPFHAFWTRAFIRIDKAMTRIPGINTTGFCLVAVGRKPCQQGEV